MGQSQLVGFRARTSDLQTSRLLSFRAQNSVSLGTSRLVAFRAQNRVELGRSELVSFRARTSSTTTPVAVLAGPAVVEPKQEFTLSLAGSTGSPDEWEFILLSGPAPDSINVVGAIATIVAPAVRPNPVGYPNDQPIVMVWQGLAKKNGGSLVGSDIRNVTLRTHSFWDVNGPVQFYTG